MKKVFRKSAVLLLVMCICSSLCMSMTLSTAFAQESGDTSGTVNIRETDVSEARDGRLLVKINGLFSYVSKDTILERINEIRLEACNEGIIGLTPDQYVPIRWSSDLEWIAQTRAAEAVLLRSHNRPNGGSCFNTVYNGVRSNGEVLAWNYTFNSQEGKRMADIMQGIEQWYEEKNDLLNNTGGETGHYLIMIDPGFKCVGIGGFATGGTDLGCVAGEFSTELPQSEAQTGVSGEYDQILEIETSSLGTIDSADTTVITVGKPFNLNARFISTYEDESCPYETRYVSCELVPLNLVWKSADTSIATVDSNGVVTGVSPGYTTITASYKSYSYSTYIQVKAYDPRDYNTDTDVGSIDGEYIFTGDGDWYGWSSYVNYDPQEGRTVIARTYKVTLPQDGRLKIEMTADAGIFLIAHINSDDDTIQKWTMGESGKSLDFCETSNVLQKGTYYVIMGYDLETRDEYLFNGYPGKNYFYHRLTFVELTEQEAEQIEIEKMKEKAGKAEAQIDLIPDVSKLTLDDEDAVNAAVEAFNALSDKEKDYVSTGAVNKLNAAVDRINELKTAPDDPVDPCEYGHTYLDAEYVWSDDNLTCTATKKCKYNSTHILTETVSTTAMVTKPATYTTRGETTYTAAFTNKAFWSQTKTVANIPVLAKKVNPITVKAKAVKVKYKSLKKKTQIIAATKAFAVSKAQGKVTYKVVKFDKKAKKKINVNSAGKVTVKKGLKKGTYKIKVQVTAAGSTAYKAGSKTVTLTIKIK